MISQIGHPGSAIRERADTVCDHIIDPAAEEFNLTVARSDRDVTPGQITSQIVRGILDATVVIADLTGRNPSVFYELAIAQSFGKPTVLLINDANDLPFDTRNERTIVIGDSEGPITLRAGIEAQGHLKSALAVVLAPDYTPSSLITEVAGVRSLDEPAPDNPVAQELAVVRTILEEMRSHERRPTSAYREPDVRQLMDLVTFLAGAEASHCHRTRGPHNRPYDRHI